MGMGDRDLGAKSSGVVVEEFFEGRISVLVNLQSIFHAGDVDKSRRALEDLGISVIHPIMVYHSSEEEWSAGPLGISSGEVGWRVAMPEFEGAIDAVTADEVRVWKEKMAKVLDL